MKKLVFSLVLISIFIFSACECQHNWEAATCNSPKMCAICHVVEGQSLKHDWSSATCIAPVTCLLCGETAGSSLDHAWLEATCSAPKICSRCGISNGENLNHIWDETGVCSNCHETKTSNTIENEPQNITSETNLHSNDNSNSVVADNPSPTEPLPTEPAPTEPTPTEPTPTEPAPTVPSEEKSPETTSNLENYNIEYATITESYNAQINLINEKIAELNNNISVSYNAIAQAELNIVELPNHKNAYVNNRFNQYFLVQKNHTYNSALEQANRDWDWYYDKKKSEYQSIIIVENSNITSYNMQIQALSQQKNDLERQYVLDIENLKTKYAIQ